MTICNANGCDKQQVVIDALSGRRRGIVGCVCAGHAA